MMNDVDKATREPWARKGTNQTTVRDFNERLILHLIRRQGALSKADATRATGLSPNAVSTIFKALEQDGLLARGEATRGRIGQPSVPLHLNPDGRFYIGLKNWTAQLRYGAVRFLRQGSSPTNGIPPLSDAGQHIPFH